MLRKKIIDKVVNPIEITKYDTVQAEIVSYSEKNNTATIQFQDPRGGGIMELDNVPIQLGSGGVHSAGPFTGDMVWVSFSNRNLLFPKIVSLADEDYESNTRERYNHANKCGYIPTPIENSEVTEFRSIADTWIDYKNNNENKYAYYSNENPNDSIVELVSDVGYYKNTEPGVTHPVNGSTIKIDDNGTIYIYTELGQGIEINPVSKTISMDSYETNIRSNNWTVKCNNDINISAKGNITFDSDKEIRMYAKEFINYKKE